MWEKWGLKDNPYSQNPIDENSLDLFVGRKKESLVCANSLSGNNSRIVIEGGRGMGTTSLCNYIRYTLVRKKAYLTPDLEISVGRDWNSERLLVNVLSAVVYALEKRCRGIASSRRFQNIKRVTQVIEKKFKSFGGQVLGIGGQYGETGAVSHPDVIPVTTLSQYMNELSRIAKSRGYRKGTIIHLNNFDINTTFEPVQLKNFLNETRDSFQLDGYHWFLVGDTGFRGFIGSNVDRLDDIITAEVNLAPLSKEEVSQSVDKRIRYYSLPKTKVVPPVEFDVIEHLYDLTGGRLRYIFGMCTRLLSLICNEAVIRSVDLKFAKPIITRLAEERISQRNISPLSLVILRKLVESDKSTTMELARNLKKGQTSISRGLAELLNEKLVKQEKVGRNNIYYPSLDAKVAYIRAGSQESLDAKKWGRALKKAVYETKNLTCQGPGS